MFFFFVLFKYLPIAGALYLPYELNAFLQSTFLDEKMSNNILSFMVNAIQVIMIILAFYLDVLFIKMLPAFKFWFYFQMQWILKK